MAYTDQLPAFARLSPNNSRYPVAQTLSRPYRGVYFDGTEPAIVDQESSEDLPTAACRLIAPSSPPCIPGTDRRARPRSA